MATIIIPAHNEAAVLADTLTALVSQLDAGDQLIVVSNGSTDGTDAVARQFGNPVTVLTTAVASKTNAINLGEQFATSFPRVYLDADVRLAAGSLARLKAALTTTWHAASPGALMDFSGSSWAVKAYYRIWLSLPYCREGLIGSGVYALSETGRNRFDRFPDVIADDGYVRALFREHERGRVEDAFAVVRAPANLRWLMKIKTRSRLGQKQIRLRFPELAANERKDYSGAALRILRNPLNWAAAAVYFYVTIASRVQANRRLANLSGYQWEKDHSSRRAVPERSA